MECLHVSLCGCFHAFFHCQVRSAAYVHVWEESWNKNYVCDTKCMCVSGVTFQAQVYNDDVRQSVVTLFSELWHLNFHNFFIGPNHYRWVSWSGKYSSNESKLIIVGRNVSSTLKVCIWSLMKCDIYIEMIVAPKYTCKLHQYSVYCNMLHTNLSSKTEWRLIIQAWG